MKPLSHDLSVMSQIEATEVATLAARRFKSIIGNHPEGEAHDQPARSSLVAEGEWHEVSDRQMPVVSGEIGPDHVKRFAEALHELPSNASTWCCRSRNEPCDNSGSSHIPSVR